MHSVEEYQRRNIEIIIVILKVDEGHRVDVYYTVISKRYRIIHLDHEIKLSNLWAQLQDSSNMSVFSSKK